MSVYQTEEEQVEALKKWWKENGVSVITGIVLGFAAIGGWQGWEKYQASEGEAASVRFEQLHIGAKAGDTAAALEAGKQVLGEHGGSAYSVLSALQMAKMAYESGDKEGARKHLEWAMDNAPDPALVELARVRLARLLVDLADIDAASALIAKGGDGMYAAEFAELAGDVARGKGDNDAAKAAYQRSLDAGSENAEFVRMKLSDLGGGSAS